MSWRPHVRRCSKSGFAGRGGPQPLALSEKMNRSPLRTSSRRRVPDAGVSPQSRVTTVNARSLGAHQQLVRVEHERASPVAAPLEERVFASLVSSLKNSMPVLSDYDKGLITIVCDRVLALGHHLKVPVFVKPKNVTVVCLIAARG